MGSAAAGARGAAQKGDTHPARVAMALANHACARPAGPGWARIGVWPMRWRCGEPPVVIVVHDQEREWSVQSALALRRERGGRGRDRFGRRRVLPTLWLSRAQGPAALAPHLRHRACSCRLNVWPFKRRPGGPVASNICQTNGAESADFGPDDQAPKQRESHYPVARRPLILLQSPRGSLASGTGIPASCRLPTPAEDPQYLCLGPEQRLQQIQTI